MTVKQLSVFIENRQGRLAEVLRVLKENQVNILSISLADTTEYGLLRLIVNNPSRGCEVLLEAGFSSMLTDVLIIKIPHTAGALQKILERITEKDVNIEYMYALITSEDGKAYSVMRTGDTEETDRILTENGIELLSEDKLK